MKSLTYAILISAMILGLTGCGVSTKTHEALSQEKHSLEESVMLKDTELASQKNSLANKELELTNLKAKFEADLKAKNKEIDTLNGDLASLKQVAKDQEKALQETTSQADQLEKDLKEQIEKGEVTLKRYKSKTIINIDNSILFDSGSATLKKEVRKALLKIAGSLNNFPENSVQIEGHTDNDPIRSDRFATNWELSAARALAVLRFFVDESKFDPKRLSAAGFGQHHPIAANDTPPNKRLNRRVDIVVLPK